MENELCRSRTTRWADVEAEEDDLDMSFPIERSENVPSFKETANSKGGTSVGMSESSVDRERGDSKRKFNSGSFNVGGGGGNRQNKKAVNLSREAPFIAKISNLDYSLQLKDIQDFLRSNGIEDVKIKLPTRNGNNEGLATVEFGNFEDFSNSINNLDGLSIGSRNIRINAVPHKGRLEDRGNHRANNITRNNGNFGGGSSQSNGSQNSSSFISASSRGKNQTQSNRELSPDFSIVRRIDNSKKPDDTAKSSFGSASKANGLSHKDVGGSAEKLKPGSKPRSKGGDHSQHHPHSSTQGQNTSGNTPNEPVNNSITRNQNPSEHEKANSGTSRRWNFGPPKEKGRVKASKGSAAGKGGGTSRDSVHNGSGSTKGSGGRDSLESRKGGGKGFSGGHATGGGSSKGSSGGNSNSNTTESKVLYTSKGKTLVQRGNHNPAIETRNRFAALDES
ncbi:RNA recognition motif domain protein family protein [Cryptosporidium felis]|nr:RNA recognition motif domain protein family protein [Cryptosporidium felis]